MLFHSLVPSVYILSMSHCYFLSKPKKKKKGPCMEHECTCNRKICFCDTTHASYSDELPENLTPGTCIIIDGWIEEDCPRFAINLASSENGDVALHLNPRLFQKYISRNCRINGHWQRPEVTSVAKFELTRCRGFQISILITNREFLIAVDGKHFCGYVFRLLPSQMKILQVQGLVRVGKVIYQDVGEYPLELPTFIPAILTLGRNMFAATDGKIELPLTAFLAKGFRKGFQIEMNGRIKVHPCGFFINFQEGSRIWPPPDLHLHINFTFNPKQGKHSVMVNTRFKEMWGQAVIVPRSYFQPGSPVNIAILMSSDHYQIQLDGELLEKFNIANYSVDRIDTLYIQGDISIHPPIDIRAKK